MNINSSELKNKLKKTWINWLKTSTTHSLPNIGKTSSQLIRISWILSFLVASSYCFYAIIIMVVQYLAYEVIVNLVITQSTPTDFPAVNL